MKSLSEAKQEVDKLNEANTKNIASLTGELKSARDNYDRIASEFELEFISTIFVIYSTRATKLHYLIYDYEWR